MVKQWQSLLTVVRQSFSFITFNCLKWNPISISLVISHLLTSSSREAPICFQTVALTTSASYNMWPLISGFFHFKLPCYSIYQLYHCFLWWNTTPLHRYSALRSSTHHLMGTWAISLFGNCHLYVSFSLNISFQFLGTQEWNSWAL